MRQHPIPQNILDIEFKLFTKFTVREFVYMATGIGFGGIFLYFFTKGQLPALIAIPIFFVSSSIGLFLGLVPINDQKADVFLKNYITAITSPTRRVWRSKEMTQEMNTKMVTGDLDMTRGTMDKTKTESNPEIIGGNAALPAHQFIEKDFIDDLDQEEKKRLEALDADLKGVTLNSTTPTVPKPTTSEITTLDQQTLPKITINSSNLARFADQSFGESGNIVVIGSNGQPMKDAVVVFKDKLGRVLVAQKTNDQGYTTITKNLENGLYNLTIAGPNTKFPDVQLEVQDKVPSIKISAI
ncbi:MAG TPA: PrgI family protein [Candidatus Dojkabacteria bacterium]|nr:PrgI family protein [Candidatus Dojkabacteria bacterium]